MLRITLTMQHKDNEIEEEVQRQPQLDQANTLLPSFLSIAVSITVSDALG